MVKILTEPIRWQTKVQLSKPALEFIKRLLELDGKKRMSATDALNHVWVKNRAAASDAELLSEEARRTTMKRVSHMRKQIDPRVDEQRNQKLQKITEDFSRGVRHGHRLGATPKEEYMSKPEFVRRDNKITTAPSACRPLNASDPARRVSISQMLAAARQAATGIAKPILKDEARGVVPGDGSICQDGASHNEQGLKGAGRSASLVVKSTVPRRLSYIGAMSNAEESNLKTLFKEKQSALCEIPDKEEEDGA